jgi:thiamine kinase-like enzyme
VASHNDVCNGNWLVTADGRLYLLDYESMSLDDPALDLGAILWWYYPPKLRPEFLQIAGCEDDTDFRQRMNIRMAIHNLNIIIPRENSFDRFTAERFGEALVDFRAVVEGRENPQGYYD